MFLINIFVLFHHRLRVINRSLNGGHRAFSKLSITGELCWMFGYDPSPSINRGEYTTELEN